MWHDPRAGGRARKGGASSRRSGDHRAPRTAAFRASLRLGTRPALDVEVAHATEPEPRLRPTTQVIRPPTTPYDPTDLVLPQHETLRVSVLFVMKIFDSHADINNA